MPTNELILNVLEYGVLGLCAVTLLLVWRILQAEQRKEGEPRGGILQAAYVFMAFSLALAVLNGYVQLQEAGTPPEDSQRIAALEADLQAHKDKLLQIRSAARPILSARADILAQLPPGPARDTLQTLVKSLRETLDAP